MQKKTVAFTEFGLFYCCVAADSVLQSYSCVCRDNSAAYFIVEELIRCAVRLSNDMVEKITAKISHQSLCVCRHHRGCTVPVILLYPKELSFSKADRTEYNDLIFAKHRETGQLN